MKKSLFTAALIMGVFALSAAAQPSAISDAPVRPESVPSGEAASAAGENASLPQRSAADELVQRRDALLQQMAELNSSDPDFQSRLRELGGELQRIQGELLTIDQTGVADPAGTAFPAPMFGRGNGAVSFPAPTAAPSAEPAPFSPFNGMDVATMRRTRAELSTQLTLLNRTLGTLGSEDKALAESLTEQQRELTARIKELDERIGTPAPETNLSAAEKAPTEAAPLGAGADAADANMSALNPADINQIDSMFGGAQTPAADPTEVDGAWYSGENKNQKILDAIAELQKSNDEMNRRLDEVIDELKTIETQLKLLSRQAVTEK